MSERSHHNKAEFDLSGGARLDLAAWTAGHGQAAFSSLGRLAHRPIASAVTTLVIAVALALPLVLYIMLDNAYRAMRVVDRSAQLTVFLRHDLDEKHTASVASTLREWGAVGHARIVPRSEALAEYQRITGFDDVLAVFEGRNPLPDSIVVTPRGGEPGRAALIALRDRMLALTEVDSVQLDLEWVDRLAAIIETLRRVVQVLFAMLGLGILLIVGNTIRLGIESRREEIGIIRLFGATDAFVRRPFLYTGLWYGLTGGGGRGRDGRRRDPAGGGSGRASGDVVLERLRADRPAVVERARGHRRRRVPRPRWSLARGLPGTRRGVRLAVIRLADDFFLVWHSKISSANIACHRRRKQ